MGGKRAALLVIVLVTALIVFTVALSISSWQDRTNQTVVNQPPATQPAVPSSP